MKVWVVADTHFGHWALAEEYGARPPDFEARILAAWNRAISSADLVIHLGDVIVGTPGDWRSICLMDG